MKMSKIKRELEPHEKIIRVLMIGVGIIFGSMVLMGIAIKGI